MSNGAVRVIEINDGSVVVEAVVAGPQGPQGPGGGAAASYIHDQSAAATTWIVNHTLGFYPNVTVVDSAGTVVNGGVEYLSITQIRLTFSAPFSGKAYLS